MKSFNIKIDNGNEEGSLNILFAVFKFSHFNVGVSTLQAVKT